MTGGETLIAIGIGAGLIALGVRVLREDRIARGLDETFGDWPHLSEEIGDACKLRAGSGKADATDIQGLVALHPERAPK